MAESLEDCSTSVDTDRNIDACSFLCSQFDIFKHDYREYTPSTCTEHDEHDHCKEDDKKRRDEKKELVNVTRRLQRALASLQTLKGSEAVADLRNSLEATNAKLREAITQDAAEFSTTTVSLPTFDTVDMKLLFGDRSDIQQKSMLQRVDDEQKRVHQDLQALVGQAHILLLEYEHFKHGTIGK